MYKFGTIAICLIGGIGSLGAQAPVSPAMEQNLEKIDSLTQVLYEAIPSQNAQPVSGTTLSEELFTSQMKSLGSSIEFPYNSMVALQTRYLLNQSATYYQTVQSRMQVYFPIYEEVIDRFKLPQELKFVSIIESNLNPTAQSWCGAMGLWQFMPYTGRSMGMDINATMDERKSIIRSTEKACEYFQNSFNQFGDWLLAIASYNCGAGNVQRAINRAGGVKDFWKVLPYLPKETQNYIPKFIAAAYAFNFGGFAHGLQNSSRMLLVPTTIDSSISIKHLAAYLQVEESVIEGYNKEFLNKSFSGNTTRILLPYNLSMAYMENKDSVFAYARREKATEEAAKPIYVKKLVPYYYTIRKGQTLYSIARAHGVTVYQVKAWNGLRNNNAIAGKNLLLYKYQWVNSKETVASQ